MEARRVPPQLLIRRDATAYGGGGGGWGGGSMAPRFAVTAAAARQESGAPPRTFVDSTPLALLALERSTAVLRRAIDERSGGRGTHGGAHGGAHGGGGAALLDGAHWEGGTPAHAALLARKVPWSLFAADGAAALLDTEHHAVNPWVEVNVSGRGGAQLHALSTIFSEAAALWPQGGLRVSLAAHPHVAPTKHAALLPATARQWRVPPSLVGAVSRVIVRMEDARAATRFWVLAPVNSAALAPQKAPWQELVAGLAGAAAAAIPLRGSGVVAALVPVVPGFHLRNPLYGVVGLSHGVGADAPPVTILDAFLDTYLQVDETGEAPAEEHAWAEEDDGSGAAAGTAATDDTMGAAGATGEGSDAPPPPGAPPGAPHGAPYGAPPATPRRALAFAPDTDLLVAVCDTRVALPLLTAVIANTDLRSFVFDTEAASGSGSGTSSTATTQPPPDDDMRVIVGGSASGGGGGGGGLADASLPLQKLQPRSITTASGGTRFVVDWGMVCDRYEWLAWGPTT